MHPYENEPRMTGFSVYFPQIGHRACSTAAVKGGGGVLPKPSRV